MRDGKFNEGTLSTARRRLPRERRRAGIGVPSLRAGATRDARRTRDGDTSGGPGTGGGFGGAEWDDHAERPRVGVGRRRGRTQRAVMSADGRGARDAPQLTGTRVDGVLRGASTEWREDRVNHRRLGSDLRATPSSLTVCRRCGWSDTSRKVATPGAVLVSRFHVEAGVRSRVRNFQIRLESPSSRSSSATSRSRKTVYTILCPRTSGSVDVIHGYRHPDSGHGIFVIRRTWWRRTTSQAGGGHPAGDTYSPRSTGRPQRPIALRL
jgi:hypothetical protein